MSPRLICFAIGFLCLFMWLHLHIYEPNGPSQTTTLQLGRSDPQGYFPHPRSRPLPSVDMIGKYQSRVETNLNLIPSPLLEEEGPRLTFVSTPQMTKWRCNPDGESFSCWTPDRADIGGGTILPESIRITGIPAYIETRLTFTLLDPIYQDYQTAFWFFKKLLGLVGVIFLLAAALGVNSLFHEVHRVVLLP